MKKITRLLSLDLEMNQPSGNIIQIGACACEIASGEVLDTFCQYITLPGDEQITPFIAGLTGISQAQVDMVGVPIAEGYQNLRNFMQKYDIHFSVVTWGGGDNVELVTQAQAADPNAVGLGRRWIDAKTLYISYRLAIGLDIQSGLAKSMTKMGLVFKGRKHDAVDDAVNTWTMYKTLLKLFNHPE